MLLPGDDWRRAINDAIKSAFAVVAILSPEAKASEYFTYEWAFALGAGVRIIPVLYRNTTLHPMLESIQFLDFTQVYRPWGKFIEILRVAANLKGIDAIPDKIEFVENKHEPVAAEHSKPQLEIFMSYAHDDEKWRRELEKQLSTCKIKV